MDNTNSWKSGWNAGLVVGFVGAILSLLVCGAVYSMLTAKGVADTNALHNLALGAWADGVMAKVFTCCNVAVVFYPFMVWRWKRDWYEGAFDFCRKLPTMIGMLGTLWSLVSANLESPGQLAGNFSVAIVSTFIGIVLQIAIELVGRLHPFGECDSGAVSNEKI